MNSPNLLTAAGPPAQGRWQVGRCRPWLRIASLTLLAMIPLVRGVAADSDAALEYKIKSGYLFNIARLIEWPASTFPAADSPFVIGVLDGGEALPVVRSIFADKTLNGHVVQIKAVPANRIDKDMHILLVTRASGKSPEELKAALGGAATLLVGETSQFAERGGMVGFVREDDAIRLTLNLERATEVDLKLSSKLSTVAKIVKSKPAK